MQLSSTSADEPRKDLTQPRVRPGIRPVRRNGGKHMTAATFDIPRKFTFEDEQELPAELVADLLGRIEAYRQAPVPAPEETALRLEHETEAAVRWDRPFGCVLVQLDALDELERQHGSAARARALRESARRIRETVRTSDFVGYWGSDTLLLVLPATWTDGVAVVADRVLGKLCMQPVSLGRKAGATTLRVSVGAAGWRTSMRTAEDMWTQAFRDMLSRREHRSARLALAASL
jgi:diguanylate cyclase (GGDEF)-like protein